MSDVAADRIEQKWSEYAESVEALAARVGNPDDFPVVPHSLNHPGFDAHRFMGVQPLSGPRL